MANPKSENMTVQFHFGAEHTSFVAGLGETLGSLKEKAMTELKIVLDPSLDYLLNFQGSTIENETQTLGQLLGDQVRPHVEFHIKKRPKGGRAA